MNPARSVPPCRALNVVAAAALLCALALPVAAADESSDGELAALDVAFEAPVRLKAGDTFISVESPGWACPTMADVDHDGLDDLVVGQFRNGHMQFCKNVAKVGEAPQFAAAQWIMTGSGRAVVPGVW